MSHIRASIRLQVKQFKQILEYSTPGANVLDNKTVLVKIADGELRTFSEGRSKALISSCVFAEDYFDHFEFDSDTEILAVLNRDTIFDYLTMNSWWKTLQIDFVGQHNSKFVSAIRIISGWSEEISCEEPSEKLISLGQDVDRRFTQRNEFMNSEKTSTLPTECLTTAETMQRMTKIVDELELDFYPFLVLNGELKIMVGNEAGMVRGDMNGEVLYGPDVHNFYHYGFKDVFRSLSGPLRVSTGPSGQPLCVVHNQECGVARRYLIAQAKPRSS